MAKSSTSFGSGNKAAAGHGPLKLPDGFRLKCREVVDELVISRWREEVQNLGEHWVKCSELLVAYGYGKPPQPVEVSGEVQHEHSGLEGPRRVAVLDAIREEGVSETTH